MMHAGNEVMTRYLLGQLDDLESRRLEEAFFKDEEVFDQLQVAEGELIEAYLYDELSAEQRRQFERQLASSPRRRSRVETWQLLGQEARRVYEESTDNSGPSGSVNGSGGSMGSLESHDPVGPVNSVPDFGAGGTGGDLPVTKPGRRTLYRALPAAAGLLLALAVAWMWHRHLEQGRRYSAETARQAQIIDQLNETLAATTGVLGSLIATPATRGSGDVQEVIAIGKSGRVELKVFVVGPDPTARYSIRTVLLNHNQEEILTGRILQEDEEGNWYFPLRWFAEELQPGLYEVQISEEVGSDERISTVSGKFEVRFAANPQP